MLSVLWPSGCVRPMFAVLLICGLGLFAAPLSQTAVAAPLTSSLYDSGDANQADGANRDWQYAQGNSMVSSSFDAAD